MHRRLWLLPLIALLAVTVAFGAACGDDDDGNGGPIGKGICNYSAAELRQVMGMQSAAVRDVLPQAVEEAVHRDYFVLS